MNSILNRIFNGDAGHALAFVCVMIWIMAAVAAPCALRYAGENFFAVVALIADIINIPSLIVYLRIVQGEDKPGEKK